MIESAGLWKTAPNTVFSAKLAQIARWPKRVFRYNAPTSVQGSHRMASDAVARGMVPEEMKEEPRSQGQNYPRKKKPKELAVITECCTGCAGSPACVEYCPVEDCMFWVSDEDHPPFGRIQVDPILCIGCKKCTSKGPDGAFLDGCPWDAIVMVDTTEVEKQVGVMPY